MLTFAGRTSRQLLVGVLALVACGLHALPGWGQTYTWNGGSGISDNWNDALNWTSVFAPPTAPPPPFGTDLNFEFTGTKTTSIIDADWTVTQIEFISGVSAMTFTGDILTVQEHGIFNNDNSTHTFSNEEIRFQTLGVAGGLDISVLATSGNLDFNANIVVSEGLELNVGGANDVFFDGGITRSTSTSAVMTLNKSGAGELRLRDNSTGIEELNISGGSVLLSQTNNPTLDSNLVVTVFSGALFDLNGNSVNLNTLTGSGDVSLGSGTLTLGDSTNFTFGGVISETGGLTKESSGILTLQGSNTYSGATNITGGTLRLGTGGSLSSATDVSVSSGTTFDLNGQSDTVDSIAGAGTILLGGATLTVDETSGTKFFSGNIQESGTLIKSNAGVLVLSGTNNTMTNLQIDGGAVQVTNLGAFGSNASIGNATLQTTATMTIGVPISVTSTGSTINVLGGTTLTQNSLISGAGAVNKDGTGTLVLGNSNSYTGDTNILSGILRLGSSNRINNSSDVTLVAGGTLELNNFTDTVNSLSGTGGSITTGGTGGRLTVNAASGTFTWNGNISGTGGFTKSGNHTMVISAAQSYSGSTVINDGLLQFSGSGSFSAASDISVASGATWDLNGVSDTVDSISGAGSITLGGATLTLDETGGSRTFSGNITGTGSLNKSGSHTLVLSGNNTYAGELFLSGGTLSVGASSNLGNTGTDLVFLGGTLQTTGSFTNSRSVTIGPFNSGTFNVDTSTTLTQSGLVTGDSTTTLIKTGDGTFILSSASSGFGGLINITGGTFQFGSGDTVANSTDVNVSSGATFSLTQTEGIDALSGAGNVTIASGQLLEVGLENSSSTFSGIISGVNGRFGKAGTGVLTLAGSNTYTGATTITGGTLRLSGSGQLADQTDVDISAGATFDLNNVSDAIDSLTGAGSVTMGSGFSAKTLTIGSNNGGGTFSGTISGTFGNLVKTGSGTQVLSGNNSYSGTTSFNGGVLSTASSSNLGSGQLNFNSGTWQVTGSLSNSRSISIGLGSSGTIDVNTGVTLTQAGTVAGTLATLNKTGTGTMLLTASATPATMNINGGLLQFSGSGSLASSTNVNIASGATWNLNGLDDQVATISGAGSIQLNSFAELTVGANSPDTTFSGIISGTGLLIKDGDHRLTLSGANSYSAGTRINGGVLAISSDGNLGNAGSPVLMDGGTLETANSMTINRKFSLNAGGGHDRAGRGIQLDHFARNYRWSRHTHKTWRSGARRADSQRKQHL